jgi:hypothetical protein
MATEDDVSHGGPQAKRTTQAARQPGRIMPVGQPVALIGLERRVWPVGPVPPFRSETLAPSISPAGLTDVARSAR